jgi:hypothetical protein
MNTQFGEVAPWAFKFENQNQELLEPECGLGEVVLFQVSWHIPVRVIWIAQSYDG